MCFQFAIKNVQMRYYTINSHWILGFVFVDFVIHALKPTMFVDLQCYYSLFSL